jgi:hypothetical protein
MASLAVLRAQFLVLVATTSDDPLYTSAVVNGFLKDAHHAVVDEIHRANRSYLIKEVLLTPDANSQPSWASAPLNTYTFATQSPAITDFAYWSEIRKTNEDGDLLKEVRQEELRDAGNGFFTISGTDDAPVLRLSRDTESGLNLYFKYGYWPLDMQLDTDAPGGIPVQFHDVLPLEVCFSFALGGESEFPADLKQRWIDRKAALIAHVSKRGVWPSRTRVDPYSQELYV